ncbi:hypothetical protein THAOC_09834 [Thalassiosira oceanica]|uniref:Uncharacterized protein n=1 Tax=Thalassiosira oceanica TaxID=159749 RepID=K0TEH2_THAOC|nr:hypothetical protein THAOC_09834 [Thalassiosira oceanica]|eukprot:EJK68952.1 hypothetical protein THAOC_09834 [Thalassiosira oceanica]
MIRRALRVLLIGLLAGSALLPFFVTPHLGSSDRRLALEGGAPNDDGANNTTRIRPSTRDDNAGATLGGGERRPPAFLQELQHGGMAPVPLPRECSPGECAPRRYFATTNQYPPMYYLEPNQDHTGRYGMFAGVPSRPWTESTLISVDLKSKETADRVRQTLERRYNDLLESDLQWNSLLPRFLPPQFPQWDRGVHSHIVSNNSTILGFPVECCPTNVNHKFLTKNFSDENVLSDAELLDCECRSPRNYPEFSSDRPIVTIVTAFYQISSKHPVKMYEKSAKQLLATSDPMVIFCEPGSRWVKYFTEQRRHAPTIVVPLSADELRLKKHFPQPTFWKNQYEIDPEGPTHHKGVNTLLYIIWDEKIVLVNSVAMLNPFNTTQFAWVDAGYCRNPAPHLYRNSAVRINITEDGVRSDSVLMFQMIPYDHNRGKAISGNQVLVGGNSFIGTYEGISNLYSAFYETFWAMAATGKFVGSDQKVLYRTCHTYPTVCHIHTPSKWRQWLSMLNDLLPGTGREKIHEAMKMKELIEPEADLPVPPLGMVDSATSDTVWRGFDRVKR